MKTYPETEIKFELDKDFIDQYKDEPSPFGFNGAGFLAYYRSYSRKPDGEKEQWYQTVERVVNGTYSIQKRHIINRDLGWDEEKAQRSAREMYDRMFNMKFLPPGRGLWAMGSPITEEKGLFAALNNCAFVSTKNIAEKLTRPFEFMMDMSMCGVGVGFDTKGADIVELSDPHKPFPHPTYEVPDSREGWVESLKIILEQYIGDREFTDFDYSNIRPKGAPIRTFGGIAPGPEPLKKLHRQIREQLGGRDGDTLSSRDIVDLMNKIGVCVVSGNVRRSAEIAFGDPKDKDYLKLKDYYWDNVNATYKGSESDRASFGWVSNNSIFARKGMDYSNFAQQTALNGEPGYQWMENARKYGRLKDSANWDDKRAEGANPCFTGDMRLLTKYGYKSFEELNKEGVIEVMNSEGEWKPARVYKSGNKDTIEIKAGDTSNPKVIRCTEDHRFLADGETVEAKYLYGKRLAIFDKITDYNGDSKHLKYGFIQGDGSLRKDRENSRHIRPEINLNKDKDKEIASIFGLDISKGSTQTAKNITYDELEERGFKFTTLPNRNLPDYIFHEDLPNIGSFLRGLYSANGSVIEERRIALKSTNYKLVEQVKGLLNRLDIDSYITTNKASRVKFPNGEYFTKESYDLNITRLDSVIKFAESVAFVQGYKRRALRRLIQSKDPYVFSVKATGEKEDVYDFEILEGDNHWGIVEGVIAHNCVEQTLEPFELCCLVETFPSRAESIEDFQRTLKFAYLYAKTVTLCNTHWTETNRVMMRNRRIGCSMSGVAQFLDRNNIDTLKHYCEKGYDTVQYYDEVYSDWLCVPRSIKTTSVKPSGTVSLLPGVTPGIHFPQDNYYIRRITLNKDSDIAKACEEAGYKVEDAVDDNTAVKVEIPVKIEGVRTQDEVSMWEQLSLTAFMQKYWADNQVSSTVTFQEHEADQIEHALNYFQYELKGVSFLPKLDTDNASYPQMPYEPISKEEFNKINERLEEIDHQGEGLDAQVEKYCDNDSCIIE